MIRYSELRLDASTLKELSDGSVRVTGQLTHPGIFSYRNPDGTERKEYRPADEVFHKAALETFAGAPITINHPRQPDGARLVTAKSWKKDAIGHLGENIREDGGHLVADLYVRDAAAVEQLKKGNLRHISCGYSVDFDPTPGTTPEGQRYDGVQRNIRGNHVALLPLGVAPRGGEECVLRLDSNGDEDLTSLKYGRMELEALKAKVTALESELAKSRTDSADLQKTKADLDAANKRIAELGELVKPERLDALADARAVTVAAAKAEGIETAGKSTLDLKRAIVAKRTPDLAARVDSLGEESVDAILAVYRAEAPAPVAAPLNVLTPPARTDAAPASEVRADAAPTGIPKIADLYEKSRQNSMNAWKNSGERVS